MHSTRDDTSDNPAAASLPLSDPLEEALALAARAGRWEVVEVLAGELRARRHEAADVAELADEKEVRTRRR